MQHFISGGKKFIPHKNNKSTILLWACAFAIVGGIIALLATHAAPTVTIDSSLPKPTNVRAFADDQSLIVDWNEMGITDENGNGDPRLVGYYVLYKKKGASTWENAKQTIYHTVQLQPLVNGQEYEISVQSAAGTYQQTQFGTLTHNTDTTAAMYWARADGKVSAATTVNGTPSSARVDAMRQRLTGFFDDFNEPANPMNELKWNNTSSGCAGEPIGAFVNSQFHVHNSSFCDSPGGITTRPRAIFDTNGATESNPARIEWDMDFSKSGRSTWYLDLIPEDVRTDKQILDTTTTHDLFDTVGQDPTNFLRINANNQGMHTTYFDDARVANRLDSDQGPVQGSPGRGDTACGFDWMPTDVSFWDCDMTRKVAGRSPLPEPDNRFAGDIQATNVRRHWVVELTPTKMRVYVDSTLISESDLPQAWATKKRYMIHNTMFSYNANKGWEAWDFKEGKRNMGRDGVFPYMHFYHWDNFGFTGPAPATVVHNYIEGGADGKTPNYFNMNGTKAITEDNRTTSIPVPDPIGTPTKSTIYYTTNNRGYTWSAADHIILNGKRYNVPNPFWNMRQPVYNAFITEGFQAEELVTTAVPVNTADLKQGINSLVVNVGGSIGWPAMVHNLHLELEYPKASAPSQYTQPVDIYRQIFSNIVEPKLTNCDSYMVIEQDLGLPYPDGRAPLVPGTCDYINTIPNHAGHTNTAPAPDTIKPTVSLTAPANNTTLTGSTVTASATASDNAGISSVTFSVGNSVVATDNTAPYSANIDFTSYAPGTYAVAATAWDLSNNSTSSSAVSVIKPQPADTTKPTISAFTPANGTAVAASATSLKLTVTATDNVGITRVDFKVDGVLMASKTTPESGNLYSYTFNPASLQAGSHNWLAEIRDAAGNLTTSNTYTFTTTTATVPPDPNPDPNPTPVPDPNPTPNKAGDINGDGKVNIQDLVVVINNYSKTVTVNTNGDLNGDGKVGIADLSILLNNYGK